MSWRLTAPLRRRDGTDPAVQPRAGPPAMPELALMLTPPDWAKVRSSINRSWRPTPMDALTMLLFAVATLLTLDLAAAQLR